MSHFLNVLALNVPNSTSVNGKSIDLRQFNGFSCQVVTTGTLTGTIKAYVTNYIQTDQAQGLVQPASAATYTENTTLSALFTLPSGTAGSQVFDVENFRGGWLQLRFSGGGSSGTCKVYLHAKGHG